jgi:voltage-gated potassium channel
MDERSDRIAQRFERPLVLAAVLTIPVTILQLLPPPDPWRTLGDVLNWAIWITFLADAVVMLAVVPSKRRWLRENPIDIAIVLFTCPILAVVIQSARVLRLVRLLRFLRLAPLVRTLFTAEGVRYAALLTLLTALTGGAAFASVENISVGNGLYWAITTMTTVGYGDYSPKTAEGKVIAIAVMMVGIGFATLLVGAIAQRFIKPEVEEVQLADEDLVGLVRDISARLQRLERALEHQRSAD